MRRLAESWILPISTSSNSFVRLYHMPFCAYLYNLKFSQMGFVYILILAEEKFDSES